MGGWYARFNGAYFLKSSILLEAQKILLLSHLFPFEVKKIPTFSNFTIPF